MNRLDKLKKSGLIGCLNDTGVTSQNFKQELNQMNDEIIKCNNCGQVLISGKGSIAIFGLGTSIECLKCGNKYTFGLNEVISEYNQMV